VIPVPEAVVRGFSEVYGVLPGNFERFAGGMEESDGILYAYQHARVKRLLKVLAVPEEQRRQGLLRFDERLKFMHYLGEHGAHIAYPLPSPQGALYETLAHAGHVWVAYSMDIAPGKINSPHDDSPGFFRNWGQAIGMLHRLVQQYPAGAASIDPETGEPILTWQEEWQGFYDWCQDEEVKARWVEIKEVLDTLPKTRDVYGFIHNDPHLWNLLVDGDRITLLDFDVANHHWFATDISIALQSVLFAQTGGLDRPVHDREKLLRLAGWFFEGYEREHHLPPEWLDRLDLFIAYRRILMFIVMYGGISSNPGAHVAWKDMILTHPPVLGTDAF
jgi:amicoumacin kinase